MININQRKCKNCGAPIEHLYNHKCPYCHSFIDFNIDKTEDINPRYMYDVNVIGIEREPMTDNILIRFKGKYLKASEALEYTNKNALIKIDYESTIPKDVCYMIRIPFFEYREMMNTGDIRPLIQLFPFEIDKRKFVEAILNFRKDQITCG